MLHARNIYARTEMMQKPRRANASNEVRFSSGAIVHDSSNRIFGKQQSMYAQATYGNQAILRMLNRSPRSFPAVPRASGFNCPHVLNDSRDSDTYCDLETGKPVVTIRNHKCGEPCTVKHEAVHVDDIGRCCENAGKAYRKAPDENKKKAAKGAWGGWMNANRQLLECRAYTEGVKCIDSLRKTKECHVPSPPDRECCHDLELHRRTEVDERDDHCKKMQKGKTQAFTPCPFA